MKTQDIKMICYRCGLVVELKNDDFKCIDRVECPHCKEEVLLEKLKQFIDW